MHINNVSTSTSKQLVVTMSFLSILVVALFLFGYLANTGNEPSIADFWNWYWIIFQELQAEMDAGEKWFVWVFLIVIPITIFIGLINSIIARNKAIKKEHTALHIKSIDFLPNGVNFNFFAPQYNFICGYDEISNLELEINTKVVQTKNGSYVAFNELILKFTVLNGKFFSLHNTSINFIKTIYGIIDYARNMKSFSYKFTGAGEITSVREKIEDYINSGCKQVLATDEENICKLLSIAFFAFGMFLFYSLKDIVNIHGDFFVLNLVFVILAISLIFDIFLLIDKWNENRYKGLRK